MSHDPARTPTFHTFTGGARNAHTTARPAGDRCRAVRRTPRRLRSRHLSLLLHGGFPRGTVVDVLNRFGEPPFARGPSVIARRRVRRAHGQDRLYAIDAETEVVQVHSGGRIVVTIGEGEFELGEGDTLSFDGHEPHAWRNVADADSVVLFVLVPGAAGFSALPSPE